MKIKSIFKIYRKKKITFYRFGFDLKNWRTHQHNVMKEQYIKKDLSLEINHIISMQQNNK